jgi:hypothetical protein
MEARFGGVQRQRPPNQRARLVEAAALVLDEAQEIEGVGVLGHDLEHGPVVRLGALQVPALVLRQASRERALQRVDRVCEWHAVLETGQSRQAS